MLLQKTCQRLIVLGKKSAQRSPKTLSTAGLIELHTFKVLEGDYGVNIATGDLDGDGIDEIITGLGPGPQNEPRVKIFKSDGTEIGNFLAYPAGMDYGVRVSSGRTGQ
jgi:hypothetical protein